MKVKDKEMVYILINNKTNHTMDYGIKIKDRVMEHKLIKMGHNTLVNGKKILKMVMVD